MAGGGGRKKVALARRRRKEVTWFADSSSELRAASSALLTVSPFITSVIAIRFVSDNALTGTKQVVNRPNQLNGHSYVLHRLHACLVLDLQRVDFGTPQCKVRYVYLERNSPSKPLNYYQLT